MPPCVLCSVNTTQHSKTKQNNIFTIFASLQALKKLGATIDNNRNQTLSLRKNYSLTMQL